MDSIINLSYKYYNEALEYIKSSNISKAKYKLEEAIKIYDSDCEILNLLGGCEYLLCNFEKAKYYWEKSLLLDSSNEKIESYLNYIVSDKFKDLLKKYNESIAYIKNNDYINGINLMLKVIDIDENIIEPYYILGVCYLHEIQYQNSIKYLKIARNKDTGNKKYLECLSEIMNNKLIENPVDDIKNNKSNKLKSIIIFIMTSIILFGGYFIYNNRLLKEKEITNLDKEKIKLEEKLYLINENNHIIAEEISEELYMKSINCYKAKQYSEALSGFEYIIENTNNDNYLKQESIYLTGLSYEYLKEFDLAKKYYNLYIEKYPNGHYYKYSIYNINKLTRKN